MTFLLGKAALALVGVPFRLHGRDPRTGLDCVGLVAVALARCGRKVVAPRGYAMRSVNVDAMLHFAAASGLEPVAGEGDVILAAVHAVQAHLLIAAPGGFVHAHAGLGRVTYMPAPLPWPSLRQWRLADPED